MTPPFLNRGGLAPPQCNGTRRAFISVPVQTAGTPQVPFADLATGASERHASNLARPHRSPLTTYTAPDLPKRHDPYSSLRVPLFRRYLIASSLVRLGTAAQGLAIGWEVYDRTGQALSLGMVGLVQAIPMLLLTLPAGYLADVFDRRKLMMLSLAGATLCSLPLAAFSWYQMPVLWMYWLLFLDSSFRRLDTNATIVTNGASVLQSELGDRQWDESVFIGLESMPLHQQVEGGHGEAEMGGEIRPRSMGLLLKAAGSGEHGKDGLNEHPLVPRVARTDFQVGRITGLGMKAWVAEEDHLLLEASDHRMKDRIVDLCRIPIPIDDPAPLIDDNAELTADDPTMIGEPFLPNGVLRPALTHRMAQLNAIAVDHPQCRRRGAEAVGPLGMSGE